MDEFAWIKKIDDMHKNITLEQTAAELELLLDKYDWFYTTVIEGNSVAVYVSHMNREISAIVPDVLYGYQIKLGYKSYLECAEKYGKKLAKSDIVEVLEYTE